MGVDDLPFLASDVSTLSGNFVQYLNWLSFNILIILDSNNLVVLDVIDISTVVLEHLPPS
jgi:hypothetical protein